MILRTHHYVAASFLLAIVGCNPTNSTGGKPAPAAPTVLATDFPKQKDLRRVIEQPATIEAFEETPLVTRIPGHVAKVSADIGKEVKVGDVLAELSVPELLSELKQKQAFVTQAKAEVDQASASLEAADAYILTAKSQVREAATARTRAVASYDYWKTQSQRVADAVAKGVIEKQVGEETFSKYRAAEAYREEVEAKVQSAQATAKESEAKRNKAKADVEAARARVLVTQAEEGRLAALAEYRFIRAPFDGVVSRRNIHTGHFLQPGPNALFVVARVDTFRVISEIPEAEASFVTPGMTGKIQPPVLKDQVFEGKVARTSETQDAKARTLRVEIDFPPPGKARLTLADWKKDNTLRPGMYANVSFTVTLEKRWTLPASAVFTHADQPCCWRVGDDRKAMRAPLKVGIRDGKEIEIVKIQTRPGSWDAITGNEEIVVANLGAVSEGKLVPAKNP